MKIINRIKSTNAREIGSLFLIFGVCVIVIFTWDWIGITDYSFLRFIQIIICIIFVLLHIGLLYCEFLYLESKITDKSESASHMESQTGVVTQLKRIATEFIGGVGLSASYLTIRYPSLNRDK